MAFDQETRNRLQRFVAEARDLLGEEFTRQLQLEFGLDPKTGAVTDLAKLTQLDNPKRDTARVLRETLEHYQASSPSGDSKEALSRIVREQAFTVLNRLCALRMAEARDLVIESVALGYQSKGFRLYAQPAGTALGETGDAYRCYLFSLFDELSVDLPVLFDRFSPQGRLFPREATLLQVLEKINHPDIDSLWAEDETIGWIYQYFNSVEERRQMRAESQAPRNSRELAVRNQFFTPRYVVEFLTDNTLGRIWYEMTQGNTILKNTCRYLVCRPSEVFLKEGEQPPQNQVAKADLSQEELLKQPVYIPFRPLKDPRDLKMLDPACGSMHFGLYAFDLFEHIYEEAWELEAILGPDGIKRPEGMAPLRESYESKNAFLWAVPRLIVERNIHGIDIDPRAVQIAGLSLWLRAHKSWHGQKVKPQDRPQIRRSHVVCAEPMPGEKDMLEGFLGTLQKDRLESLIRRVMQVPEEIRVRATPMISDRLCQFVRVVWDRMQLAGEAGSLLKIESELQEAIRQEQEEWEKRQPLFRVTEYNLNEEPKEHYYQFVPGNNEGQSSSFWDWAERLVLGALEEYAGAAVADDWSRRRLFVDDAVRGLGFVDVCQHRYDVVLMNPPFGWGVQELRKYQERKYPNSKNDLYCMFVERAVDWCVDGGLVGSITSRTAFFLPSMRLWRENVLLGASHGVGLMADLGFGVLDSAFVETAAFTVAANKESIQRTMFFRLNEVEDKGQNLRRFIQEHIAHSLTESDIKSLPGYPFSYWISPRVRKLFSGPNVASSGVTVAVGLATSDNERFLRLRWETKAGEERWVPYPKGGDYAKYHQDIYLVVNWNNNGAEIKTQVATRYGSASRFVQNTNLYRKPGLTYPRVSVKGFSARLMPAGCIFSDVGQGVFSDTINYWLLLGFLNSPTAEFLLRALTPSRKWDAGFLKCLPYPELSKDSQATVIRHAQEIVRLLILNDRLLETSGSFLSPLNDWSNLTISELVVCHDEVIGQRQLSITAFQEATNSLVLEALKLSPSDVSLPTITTEDQAEEAQEGAEEDDLAEPIKPDSAASVRRLLSYFVGCAFGRWDVRVATGEKKPPELPDPFTQFPPSPPGMLQGLDGLSLTESPAGYPLHIPWDGILSDDLDHKHDIARSLVAVLGLLWGDCVDAVEQEVCQILGMKQLRDYLRKSGNNGFFDDHLKRYSKSRRYAPIYWPLSTPSLSYTLWVYYHRLTDQTLFSCVNNFLEPKLKQVSKEANLLLQKSARSRADEDALGRLSDLEQELTGFRTELLRLAPIWKPNLNDGIQITAAPLWKLFQHRQWQNRLKETWEQLESGEYDWAHIAFSLWPDRIREKCKTDKSLAIAHGLEHLYQEPTQQPRRKSRRSKQQEEAADED